MIQQQISNVVVGAPSSTASNAMFFDSTPPPGYPKLLGSHESPPPPQQPIDPQSDLAHYSNGLKRKQNGDSDSDHDDSSDDEVFRPIPVFILKHSGGLIYR